VTRHALGEFFGKFRLFFNDLLVAVFAVHVSSAFETIQFFRHLRTFVVAVFTFADFLTFFVGNLLAVFGAVVAISTLGDFLMLGMGKYRRLGLFGLVLLGLQDHCRTKSAGPLSATLMPAMLRQNATKMHIKTFLLMTFAPRLN